jgi:hypothetical protein
MLGELGLAVRALTEQVTQVQREPMQAEPEPVARELPQPARAVTGRVTQV